jgi:hypothetical protein
LLLCVLIICFLGYRRYFFYSIAITLTLVALCFNDLVSLVTEDNVKIATEQKALHHVCSALKTHMNSPEVAEAASAALLSLTLNGESFFCLGQGVQQYVIKFVSDLRQVGGFLRFLLFPPTIKLTATI